MSNKPSTWPRISPTTRKEQPDLASDLHTAFDFWLSQPNLGAELTPAALIEILGRLRALELRLLSRHFQGALTTSPPPSPPDDPETWLTPAEVAQRLHKTTTWVYRHARHWSFAKRPSRKTLLISERGLQLWLQRR